MLYIKKLLFLLPISVLRFLYVCKNFILWTTNRKLRQDVYRQIDKFTQGRADNSIKKDVIRSYILSLTMPYEYFCYGYEELGMKERREYLTDIERTMYLNKYSGPDKFIFLSDKYLFCKTMKQFFKRDVCYIENESNRDSFKEFIIKHNNFIAKPNKGSWGKHTKIYH